MPTWWSHSIFFAETKICGKRCGLLVATTVTFWVIGWASKAFHYDVYDHLGLVAGSSSGPSRLWCRIWWTRWDVEGRLDGWERVLVKHEAFKDKVMRHRTLMGELLMVCEDGWGMMDDSCHGEDLYCKWHYLLLMFLSAIMTMLPLMKMMMILFLLVITFIMLLMARHDHTSQQCYIKTSQWGWRDWHRALLLVIIMQFLGFCDPACRISPFKTKHMYTHWINVWYVYLHLVDFFSKYRHIYHMFLLWDISIYIYIYMFFCNCYFFLSEWNFLEHALIIGSVWISKRVWYDNIVNSSSHFGYTYRYYRF